MNRYRYAFVAALVLSAATLAAQQGGRGGAQAPQVVSPEVTADRRISFRIVAPQAREIRLNASDIPGLGQNTRLTKADNGVWELTVGPLDSGAYRYNFNVDGVATIDPRNPEISESNNNVWSLVYVPGSDLFDSKAVPHGVYSPATITGQPLLAKSCDIWIYTPPGYTSRSADALSRCFYLLHGYSDAEDAWTTVGRANVILDNLIARGAVKPMLVVMPAGHTWRWRTGQCRSAGHADG